MGKCLCTIEGHVLILHPEGALTHDGSEVILDSIREIVREEECSVVVLDLSKTFGRTSEALCPLIGALNVAKRLQCKFALACFPESLRTAFTLCQLDKIFIVRDTVKEATRDAK